MIHNHRSVLVMALVSASVRLRVGYIEMTLP